MDEREFFEGLEEKHLRSRLPEALCSSCFSVDGNWMDGLDS